jgi:hypothetical protein
MRFAADVDDDRPDRDAAFAREAFVGISCGVEDGRAHCMHACAYLCLVVRGCGRGYLLVVLVGDSDALKGGFEIGDLHGAGERCRLTRGKETEKDKKQQYKTKGEY